MEKKFNLNEETLKKVMKAKNPEELMALAKEHGEELTAEEAAEYFAELHKSGELSDEEIENVAGGCASAGMKCPKCHSEKVSSQREPGGSGMVKFRHYCDNCGHSWR